MPTPSEVEAKILAAVDHVVKERGGAITDGEWGVVGGVDDIWVFPSGGDTRACCPMGAVIVGTPCSEDDMEEDAAKILGVPSDWVESFVIGFDGKQEAEDPAYSPTNREGYLAGVKLRQELILNKGGSNVG